MDHDLDLVRLRPSDSPQESQEALEVEAVERTGVDRALHSFAPPTALSARHTIPSGNCFSVSGPGLAAHALRAGLVDDLHLFLAPVIVGGGTPALPDDVRLELELVASDRSRATIERPAQCTIS